MKVREIKMVARQAAFDLVKSDLDTGNVTGMLLEEGYSEDEIEKIQASMLRCIYRMCPERQTLHHTLGLPAIASEEVENDE